MQGRPVLSLSRPSRAIASIAACAVLSLASLADATTVVTDANVSLSPSGSLGDYQLTVFQDAAGTDPTSVWFDYDGTNIEIVNWNIDEGSDWYLVLGGDEFSARNIGDALFTTLLTIDSPAGPIPVGSSDFFLAVNTGLGVDASGPNRDAFGWVELSDTGTELVQLGSAMAYEFPSPGAQGNGIIVGTATTVPEPSALLLVAMGLAALAPRRGPLARAGWMPGPTGTAKGGGAGRA